MRSGFHLAAIFLSVAFQTACGKPAHPTPPPIAAQPSGIAVHVASLERSESRSLLMTGSRGEPYFLEAVPLLTEADVERTAPITSADGAPALQLYLSPRATEALAQSSERYVEQYLAFVEDDRIICCLFVHSPLSNQLIILGDSEALPTTRLDEIAARINARGTVSPTP